MHKDVITYILTILIWISSIVLWLTKGWWYITVFLLILHLIETIIIGVKTGRENDKGTGYSILMSMVFGITWWRPLRRKV